MTHPHQEPPKLMDNSGAGCEIMFMVGCLLGVLVGLLIIYLQSH